MVQRYVVVKQINEWLAQGYTAEQIPLLYNHPASGGIACGSGFNEEIGVAWNSCAYQQGFLDHYYERM